MDTEGQRSDVEGQRSDSDSEVQVHVGLVLVQTHRAVEDDAVSISQTLDVCGQVQADGPMADGVHGLSVKEVMRPG